MRIDTNVAVSPVSTTARDAHAPVKGDAASPGAAAVVHLSTAGAAMGTDAPAKASVTQRLEAIRAMIAKGEYTVDLDALASRIVEDDVLRSGGSQ